jgi:hypothetical protein
MLIKYDCRLCTPFNDHRSIFYGLPDQTYNPFIWEVRPRPPKKQRTSTQEIPEPVSMSTVNEESADRSNLWYTLPTAFQLKIQEPQLGERAWIGCDGRIRFATNNRRVLDEPIFSDEVAIHMKELSESNQYQGFSPDSFRDIL